MVTTRCTWYSGDDSQSTGTCTCCATTALTVSSTFNVQLPSVFTIVLNAENISFLSNLLYCFNSLLFTEDDWDMMDCEEK